MSAEIDELLGNAYSIGTQQDFQHLRQRLPAPACVAVCNTKISLVDLDYILHPELVFFAGSTWKELEEVHEQFWQRVWQLEKLSGIGLCDVPFLYLKCLTRRIRLPVPLLCLGLGGIRFQEKIILLLARALKFNKCLLDFRLVETLNTDCEGFVPENQLAQFFFCRGCSCRFEVDIFPR